MGHNREPIGNTCPEINEVIKKLDQIKSWCNDIIFYCETAKSDMEDLRRANDTLRGWGNDEANDRDEAECRISELELKIEELKEELQNQTQDRNPA